MDWGKMDRKNWAEKERAKYENKNKSEYEFFIKRLNWFQKRSINELLSRQDATRIGKNKHGCKLNFSVFNKTIRVFGYLEDNLRIFHALLFLVKKTNKVASKDLDTFEERIKKYENQS